MKKLQRRRAFTLLEVTLATTISATIAGVSLGLFLYFDRTDVHLQDRFIQNEQLSRLHLVSERAFSKLLIANKPKVLNDAEQKKRAGRPAGSDEPDTSPDDLLRQSPRDRRLDLKNDPELAAIRAQIPPRFDLELRVEDRVEAPVDREAGPGTSAIRAERFTRTPQRLELVLTESPVPSTSELDDPEALLARAEKQRAREKRQLRQMKAAGDTADGNTDNGIDAANPGDPAADEVDFASPIRALRGAFQLRPMMPTSKGSSAEVKGWEVWWVPLPPQAGPDEEPDAEAPELDPPFLVANNIAFIEWRAFQGRERRSEYAARLNDDIPAYVEMEVETVGGLRANWLFELGWTFGHESRAMEPPALVAGASGSGAPGSPAAGVPGAGGSAAGPVEKPAQAVTAIPLQPATPTPPRPGQDPMVNPAANPSYPKPTGPMLPVEKPAKKYKKGT